MRPRHNGATALRIAAASAALYLAAGGCGLVISLDEPRLGLDAESDSFDDAADGQEPSLDPVQDPDAEDSDGDAPLDAPVDPPEDSEVPPDGTVTVTSIFGDTPDSDFPLTVLDTYININDENNCGGDYLNTYTWPADSIANAAIIKWDLSDLPEGATILEAVLELYLCSMDDDGGDDPYTLTVHRIINHDPVICSCNGLTYDGANPWTPYEGLFNDIPLAQSDIAPAESSLDCDRTLEHKSWDVTAMVSAWVEGREPNYGMLLNSDPSAAGDSNRYFCSSDHAEASRRPRLVVTYRE